MLEMCTQDTTDVGAAGPKHGAGCLHSGHQKVFPTQIDFVLLHS